jgi:hypothetical protein
VTGIDVRRALWWTAALAAVALPACQEQLTAPADCPTFCPGGYDTRDTVLLPLADQDSTFEGYLVAGQGSSLLVSDRLPAGEYRAIIRFAPRGDSVLVDSLRPIASVDSVQLDFSVIFRDTLVSSPKLYLYRLPHDIDSTTTFAQAEAGFTPAAIIDSFVLADSQHTARLTTVLKDPATLAKVAFTPDDSTVLAVGVKLVAPTPTGVRLGSVASGSSTGPIFTTFATVLGPDTVVSHPRIVRQPRFNSYVSQVVPVLDPDQHTIGGAPSARSLLRFPLPARIKDSVTILRATLQLVPTSPIDGLTGDEPFIDALPVLADFGAKSPVSSTLFSAQKMTLGSSDTVSVEVVRLVRLWQSANSSPTPPAMFLQLAPEVSSFSRVTFGSTRTPGFVPVLRLTYAINYPFEKP